MPLLQFRPIVVLVVVASNYLMSQALILCISYIHSHLFHHLRDHYEFMFTIDQLPVGLIAQLVRMLHRYRRRVMGSNPTTSESPVQFSILILPDHMPTKACDKKGY